MFVQRTVFLFSFSAIIALLFFSSYKGFEKTKIQIHYTLNYKDDSWEKNRTGLLWCLSYLGAELPKGSLDKSIKFTGKQTFILNLNGLGFNSVALAALKTITDSLKQTEAYQKRKAVDLGQFIALTLGSSWHYYQITGAPPTYAQLLKEHGNPEMEQLPITSSSVAKHHRVIKISCQDSVRQSLFISEEGLGSVQDGSFIKGEFEVIDVMKNGLLRVMIYNSNGQLIPAGSKEFGIAGKPAKCVWCHELNIPRLLSKTDSVVNFMKPSEFQAKITRQNELLIKYRESLNGDLDFSKKQDHTYQELIYIAFMEPSLLKLSQEWNMPYKKLESLLKDKQKHLHHEFSFLGELVKREDILHLNYNIGQLPGSIREESESEPNYFKIGP